MRNTIPRESQAVIAAAKDDLAKIRTHIKEYTAILKDELSDSGKRISISLDEVGNKRRLLTHRLPGVFMSPLVPAPIGFWP